MKHHDDHSLEEAFDKLLEVEEALAKRQTLSPRTIFLLTLLGLFLLIALFIIVRLVWTGASATPTEDVAAVLATETVQPTAPLTVTAPIQITAAPTATTTVIVDSSPVVITPPTATITTAILSVNQTAWLSNITGSFALAQSEPALVSIKLINSRRNDTVSDFVLTYLGQREREVDNNTLEKDGVTFSYSTEVAAVVHFSRDVNKADVVNENYWLVGGPPIKPMFLFVGQLLEEGHGQFTVLLPAGMRADLPSYTLNAGVIEQLRSESFSGRAWLIVKSDRLRNALTNCRNQHMQTIAASCNMQNRFIAGDEAIPVDDIIVLAGIDANDQLTYLQSKRMDESRWMYASFDGLARALPTTERGSGLVKASWDDAAQQLNVSETLVWMTMSEPPWGAWAAYVSRADWEDGR